jgi:hypothetical protein
LTDGFGRFILSESGEIFKMLSAISTKNERVLETFKLVLLLTAEKKALPESLMKYYRSVVSEASDLLKEPKRVAAEARPEAVVLAVKLLNDEALRDSIHELTENEWPEAATAQAALAGLERSHEANSQFTYLGEEIRAVI